MPFAVKTYCSRDPKSSQYLTLLKNLGACQKLVFQNVRFTRHLFAQLFSAKLTHLSPITKSIGYGLSENREAEDDMDSTEEEIGIKLFFGFELIICEAKTWITQNFDFDVNPKFFDRLVIICPELKEFFFKQA